MEKTLLILIIPPLPVTLNVPPLRKIVRAACDPSAVGSVTPRPCVASVPPLSQMLPVKALATPPWLMSVSVPAPALVRPPEVPPVPPVTGADTVSVSLD